MFRFVTAPRWFYGYDVAIDLISIAVTLLIAVYAFKLSRYTGDKRHKYFSYSFFLIAASFLLKSLSNQYVPDEAIVGQIVWAISVSIPTLKIPSFFTSTYLGYRFFTLLGLAGIYSIVHRVKRSEIWLSLYLVFLVTLISMATYLLFYATAALFLLMITLYYYKNCAKVKTPQSKLVFVSFAVIMVGQLLFLGISYKGVLYAVAQVFQLFGYLILLSSYLGLVVKDGKANKN